MTLYDYLELTDGSEITVWDSVYDIEVYFYFKDPNGVTTDKWDKAMLDMAKGLRITEIRPNGVEVNMYDVIESKLDKLDGLFNNCDMEVIMDDIENILAGNVSEEWFIKFVNVLKD